MRPLKRSADVEGAELAGLAYPSVEDRVNVLCLDLASSIRVIIGELSERLFQALKDETELNDAISKILSIGDS